MQVPWFDAVANAGWAKKACPPRPSGNMRRGVTWLANASPGAIPLRKGDKLANIWQGWLSMKKISAPMASPGSAFPPNGYGLSDMVDNTRDWCADWCRADAYAASLNGQRVVPALTEIGIRTTLWRPSMSPGVVLFFVIATTTKVIARQPAVAPRPILACPTSVFAVPGIPAGYCGVCRSVQCAMSYFAAVYLFLL